MNDDAISHTQALTKFVVNEISSSSHYLNQKIIPYLELV